MATYTKRPFKQVEKEEYICIDNASSVKEFVVLQNFTAIGIPIYFYRNLPLTIGNKYEAEVYHNDLFLKNDLGRVCLYSKDKFVKLSVEEWREQQLKKLLNENTL